MFLIGLCFFCLDWKLPPPACPGTTGIYSCFTFFMFGHILQQPLYFDILIHCPGQSICDKVARWPRSKKTALEIGLHCEGLKLEVPEMSNTSCGVSNQKQNVSNKCTQTDIANRID